MEDPKSKMQTEVESRSMTYTSGKVTSHILHRKVLKVLQFLPRILQHEQAEIISGTFYRQEFYQNHLTMESITIELVSNGSAELVPNNALSSFTNFIPEQLNLEGQREVAISKMFYLSMYQNATEGNFKIFDKRLSKLLELYYMEPGIYLFITIFVETMNTLIPKRHNHSRSCITVEVSRITVVLRFTLQMDELVLHFLLRNWDTFPGIMLAWILE